MSDEKVETSDVLQVESVKSDGGDLVISLTSPDREALVSRGRQFVLAWVTKNPEYSTWATAGVDKASGPAAFDPENPGVDPYALVGPDKKDVKWRYRQLFRLTKML